MTTESIVVRKDRKGGVEVTHSDSDPGMWIVRRWKSVLGFKRRVSSDWFTDREQALSFAAGLRPDEE